MLGIHLLLLHSITIEYAILNCSATHTLPISSFLLSHSCSSWPIEIVPECFLSLAIGAIGDVDGDGFLDLISIETLNAPIFDPYGGFLYSSKTTQLSKFNLELKLKRASKKDFVVVHAKIRGNSPINATELKKPDVRFRPSFQQPWTAYLGTNGDSVYKKNCWNSDIGVTEKNKPQHASTHRPIFNHGWSSVFEIMVTMFVNPSFCLFTTSCICRL